MPAGAVLRMLSWGIDELAGFMHQPIVLPSPRLIPPTDSAVVKESIRSPVMQHIDMGFRDWEAARSEMRDRRLFAGLVAFVSGGALGPEHDADSAEIFWSPIVWDRQTGLLHVYDAGADEKSRRPRLAATCAAWAKVLFRLGRSGGFGVHSPLSPRFAMMIWRLRGPSPSRFFTRLSAAWWEYLAGIWVLPFQALKGQHATST